MTGQRFTFIDLFAGIGGFHLALESLGGTCVFASEIDGNARATYEANHGMKPHGDIREFTGPEKSDHDIKTAIPDHNILAAGFPCQPFSMAGVSARNALGRAHGLADQTQGTLFFDIARIVKSKRPEILILENVKNIATHDKGRTFATIREIITKELGYHLHAEILSSETLVPQKRQRCYMVAFRDYAGDFEFPDLCGDPIPLRCALDEDVPEEFTISDAAWSGHQRRTATNRARGAGFVAETADLDKPSKTIVARYGKDGKECLIPQDGKNPRMLTPREAARLFGYPETFKPHPIKTHAYKQFGNSVAVPLIRKIAEAALLFATKSPFSVAYRPKV